MFGVPFRHLPIPSKEEGGKRVQEIQVQDVEQTPKFAFEVTPLVLAIRSGLIVVELA